MAVLSKMPNQAVITGFYGVVDFYLWKGIPCARMWPVWDPRDPHPLEKANQDDFAYIAREAKNLPEYMIQQYRDQAAGTTLTWRDLAIQAYMKGIPY